MDECSDSDSRTFTGVSDYTHIIVRVIGQLDGDNVLRLGSQHIFVVGNVRLTQDFEAPARLRVQEVKQLLLKKLLTVGLILGVVTPADILTELGTDVQHVLSYICA